MSSPEPTEEEVRAAMEEEMKHVRVEDVLLQSVVSLVNLGARRAGVAPELVEEADPEQVRVAVEAVRALLPLLEEIAPEQAPAIRDALSQLQLAYARTRGGAPGGSGPAPGEPAPLRPPEPPGPAPGSGRLWIPGQ